MSARFPGRKLSLVRLSILTGVVMAITAGGAAAWGNFQDERAAEAIPSVFAGYVDVTATPRYAFEDPVSKEAENVLLSFIVADREGCMHSDLGRRLLPRRRRIRPGPGPAGWHASSSWAGPFPFPSAA